MNKKLIIFGAGDIAELANYYFTHDSDYTVVAFTVDREYLSSDTFCNLPLIAFDEVENKFAPDNHDIFIALSYSGINSLRKQKYILAKSKGYTCANYISSHATVLNEYCIGENCFILEDNTIQPYVTIGNNVTLWSGNHIGHHSIIKDHSFIASHVVISGGALIDEQCFVGVNATIRDHVEIGARCVLGANAVILNDAEPDGVYISKETKRSKVPSSRLKKI